MTQSASIYLCLDLSLSAHAAVSIGACPYFCLLLMLAVSGCLCITLLTHFLSISVCLSDPSAYLMVCLILRITESTAAGWMYVQLAQRNVALSGAISHNHGPVSLLRHFG